MAYQKDEEFFYITAVGQIRYATAVENEHNGAVSIKCGNDVIGKIGTLHLCRTMRAAEIIAANRRPNKN